MRACYDGLLSAAAASANSAYGTTFFLCLFFTSLHLCFFEWKKLNCALLVVVHEGDLNVLDMCYPAWLLSSFLSSSQSSTTVYLKFKHSWIRLVSNHSESCPSS